MDQALHRGDPGGAAHQDHLIDVVLADLGVAHRLLHRLQGPLDQVGRDLLKGGPHDGLGEVLGTGRVGRDERQTDLRLGDRAEFRLGLLRSFEETLQRLRVAAQVDAVLLLELVRQVVHQAPVEVVATQVAVARGGPYLHDAVADIEDAHVEGASPEVEDQTVSWPFLSMP